MHILLLFITLDHPNLTAQSVAKTQQTLIFLAKSEDTRANDCVAAPYWGPKSVHPPPSCIQKIVQNATLLASWSPRGHFMMPRVTHKHLFSQILVKTRNHWFYIRKTHISDQPGTPFWTLIRHLAVQKLIANRFRI